MELCFLCDEENTGGCGGMREVLLSISGIFSGLSPSTQQFDGNACQEISNFRVSFKFLEIRVSGLS
jgi:hypothetical protein